MSGKKCILGLAAIAGLLSMAPPARAAFTLFDNFDSYNTGPLSGQGGWVTSGTAGAQTNVVQGVLTDKEAQVYGNSIPNYKALGGSLIPNASTAATVFFNFKMAAATTGNNFNFVLTDVAAPPDTAGSSEVQFNFDATAIPTGGTTTFRIRNGANFEFATTGGTTASEVVPIAGDEYRVWFVVNNSTDTYQVYMQSDDPATGLSGAPHQITTITGGGATGSTTFGFRNGAAANDLITANFGNGAAAIANAVNFDDIYVDTAGVNVTNPVPEPMSLGLVAMVGGAALLRRRRTKA
jgi:hypothetical protein